MIIMNVIIDQLYDRFSELIHGSNEFAIKMVRDRGPIIADKKSLESIDGDGSESDYMNKVYDKGIPHLTIREYSNVNISLSMPLRSKFDKYVHGDEDNKELTNIVRKALEKLKTSHEAFVTERNQIVEAVSIIPNFEENGGKISRRGTQWFVSYKGKVSVWLNFRTSSKSIFQFNEIPIELVGQIFGVIQDHPMFHQEQ